MTRAALFTVGYENDTQPEVIDRLRRAGVAVVLDVRAVASSRKAGFSKSLLAASLAEADIEYVHLRALGTPKPGRDAARDGRVDEMRAIYDRHLEEPQAQLELQRAGDIAADRPAALLCYEADAAGCHRSIVADRLTASHGLVVRHL